MVSTFVIFALTITFAFVHGRDISNVLDHNAIVSAEKESRIDIPLFGGIFLIVIQVAGVILSKVWSLLEYKLAAFSLISNVVSWVLKNYIIVIIGAVALIGFCLTTSLFSANTVYEIDHLVRGARSLDSDIVNVEYSRY